MSKIATRQQFIDYCLRRLGFPVIQINLDDDQISDRVDDALQFWWDYHFDGTEKMFLKHRITEEDVKRRWIYCPEPIKFVTNVFPFDDSNSSINMFDLRYQLRLHDLYDFTSVSYVSYEITMQHIQSLQLLFSGKPQFRFNRKQNRLYLDIDWDRYVNPGEYVIAECYRNMTPDQINLTGTVNLDSSTKTVIGTNTKFDAEIVENDFVHFGETPLLVKRIISPTELELADPPPETLEDVTMMIPGNSEVWDDRWLKKYATAKLKYQWGTNLSKFAGIQLPGGVTLDGPRIMEEARAELEKLEEDMYTMSSLPSEIFIG
jgi:hypothetical protein